MHVHIDVYAAQTGVTRFTQTNARWVYNKSEAVDLGRTPSEYLRYTHVLREYRAGPERARDEAFRGSQLAALGFVPLFSVRGFSRVRLGPRFPLGVIELGTKALSLHSSRSSALTVFTVLKVTVTHLNFILMRYAKSLIPDTVTS